MIKSTLQLLLFSMLSHSVLGQVLTISNSASIFISNGSSINFSGLEISPNKDFTLGENIISRTETPVDQGQASSIERVYTMTAPLNNFTGTLTFEYEENELGTDSESDLVLQFKNQDGLWEYFYGTNDPDNNTISFTFLDEISITSVTATSVDNVPDQGDEVLGQESELLASLVVFPNPSSDFVKVNGCKVSELKLFDFSGKLISQSFNESKMNMEFLKSGIYILEVNSDKVNKRFKITKN